MNLIEGLQAEMNRCRELVKQYEEIGSAGVFGKAMIQVTIREGESAMASGDVVRMMSALESLRGCE